MWIFNQEYAGFWQFVKFTLVGMVNSALYILVFNVWMLASTGLMSSVAGWLVSLLGQWIDLNQATALGLIGNVLAWFVSTTNSYWMNSKLTFDGVQVILWRVLIKFYLGYVFTNLLLYSWLTYVQMELLGMPTGLVSIVNVLIVGPVNFMIAKFWSMKPSNP